MSRVPRRYTIHLYLSGGQVEEARFATLDDFQTWYGGALTTAAPDAFVNVPLSELDGEYLVVRASAVIGLRVEPHFGTLDD